MVIGTNMCLLLVRLAILFIDWLFCIARNLLFLLSLYEIGYFGVLDRNGLLFRGVRVGSLLHLLLVLLLVLLIFMEGVCVSLNNKTNLVLNNTQVWYKMHFDQFLLFHTI